MIFHIHPISLLDQLGSSWNFKLKLLGTQLIILSYLWVTDFNWLTQTDILMLVYTSHVWTKRQILVSKILGSALWFWVLLSDPEFSSQREFSRKTQSQGRTMGLTSTFRYVVHILFWRTTSWGHSTSRLLTKACSR